MIVFTCISPQRIINTHPHNTRTPWPHQHPSPQQWMQHVCHVHHSHVADHHLPQNPTCGVCVGGVGGGGMGVAVAVGWCMVTSICMHILYICSSIHICITGLQYTCTSHKYYQTPLHPPCTTHPTDARDPPPPPRYLNSSCPTITPLSRLYTVTPSPPPPVEGRYCPSNAASR